MRKIEKSDLIEKTIIDVDIQNINVLKLTFTDNTYIYVWSKSISTPAGSVSTFLVEEAAKTT